MGHAFQDSRENFLAASSRKPNRSGRKKKSRPINPLNEMDDWFRREQNNRGGRGESKFAAGKTFISNLYSVTRGEIKGERNE